MKDILNFESLYLGILEYGIAEIKQKEFSLLVKEQNRNFILGLQHPQVITMGYRLDEQIQNSKVDHLKDNLPKDVFQVFNNQNIEIPIIKSTRGGLITLHSEGQLIIYPILNLRQLGWGVKKYVHCLLLTTQKFLSYYGVESKLDDQAIGLYTHSGKIAFCGIQISNGISRHGISINVSNDLSLFDRIISCGVQKAKMDKMLNYPLNFNFELDFEKLFNQWIYFFKTNPD